MGPGDCVAGPKLELNPGHLAEEYRRRFSIQDKDIDTELYPLEKTSTGVTVRTASRGYPPYHCVALFAYSDLPPEFPHFLLRQNEKNKIMRT